jgi:ABC-2 type transport system ATP-binding protein
MFLQAEDVVKQYANHLALNKVSINVPEGSIFGLLGPNGAGKTTLIRIINRITAPDSGTIRINGSVLGEQHVSQIGYLPEERGLYKKMKVGEQAVYLAQLKGLTQHEAKLRIRAWFEKLDIISWWDKKVEELSKGMQQKIQFVVTVIHQPKLLIFDEPFSGFDPINTEMLKREILELRRQGATIIFSTHNMASVEELCDNIALINRSTTILEGTMDEVRNRFKLHKYEAVFNGNNLITNALTENYIIDEPGQANTKHTVVNLKPKTDTTTNNIIRELLEVGELLSFKELLPSMNEIFIQAVNKIEKQQN